MRRLSENEYQWNCWVRKQCPGTIKYDDLDCAIHFLFDDSDFATDAEGMIGYALKAKTESAMVSEVCRVLDDLLNQYGTQLSDEEYIGKQEWARVLASASRAHALLVGNDRVAPTET